MPKAFPFEFRRDVVAVARKGEAPIAEVAKDFGVSEACLHRWLKLADVEDGARPGPTRRRVRGVARGQTPQPPTGAGERGPTPRSGVPVPRHQPKMMFPRKREVPPPLVRDLAAPDAPVRVPVTVTCRVLGFSKQACYAWYANPVSQRDWDDAHLIDAALAIRADDPGYGYRFIADELPARGISAGENRVARLCSSMRIWSTHSKKRGLNRRPGPPVHDDLVTRDFTADTPNTLWLTDITEHHTAEGKLYLCAIKDLHSNRIVGYSLDSRMTADLAVTALRNAVSLRDNPVGVVVHSDRGSQFRSTAFVSALKKAGLLGSMGRVGACADNAAMESFFALLQKNVLNRHRWATRAQLRLAIVIWIETSYHRRRRQRGLGRLTPVEFETIYKTAHAA